MRKTYVITGSTSGIGKALLQKLVKNNTVFAGYRNEKYVAELEKLGAIPFYIDMEREESIRQATAYIKSSTNRIDTMINVAGCVVAGVMEQISVANLRRQFEVNTFSHINFTQNLLPLLDNAKVINISSMSSFGIFPFVAPYCASKRALDILFNAMALESGLKVISIKPGVIATPLWDKSVEGNQDTLLNDNKYEKAYNYLKDNAHSNGKNGLNVKEVIKVLKKADRAKCPKNSYLVGKDAFVASVFSKLPQALINKVLQIGIKLKIYNN